MFIYIYIYIYRYTHTHTFFGKSGWSYDHIELHIEPPLSKSRNKNKWVVRLDGQETEPEFLISYIINCCNIHM